MSQQYTITFNDVLRGIANGPGHVSVLANFAGDIFGDALRAHASRRTAHVDCPFPHRHGTTGGKGDFRLKPEFDRDGSAICSCGRYRIFDLLTECGRFDSRTKAMLAVAEYLGLAKVDPAEKARQDEEWASKRAAWEEARAAANKPEEVEKRKRSLAALWARSIPLSHPQAGPARAYFAHRGVPLAVDTKAIRFVPNATLVGDDGSKRPCPAIISAVVDCHGKSMSLHRIFITEDGKKAQVEKPKRLMPARIEGGLPGCFIPAYTVGASRTLNVCEGVETAQAVWKMTQDNVWSCISSSLLQSVVVPRDRFDRVRIWADKDVKGAGQQAALRLANRLLHEGFLVEIMIPKEDIPSGQKSLDWEDVYVSRFKGMRGNLTAAASALAVGPTKVTVPFVL